MPGQSLLSCLRRPYITYQFFVNICILLIPLTIRGYCCFYFAIYLTSTQPTLYGFVTAQELSHQRRKVLKISTGSKQLDTILGGFVTRRYIWPC